MKLVEGAKNYFDICFKMPSLCEKYFLFKMNSNPIVSIINYFDLKNDPDFEI